MFEYTVGHVMHEMEGLRNMRGSISQTFLSPSRMGIVPIGIGTHSFTKSGCDRRTNLTGSVCLTFCKRLIHSSKSFYYNVAIYMYYYLLC